MVDAEPFCHPPWESVEAGPGLWLCLCTCELAALGKQLDLSEILNPLYQIGGNNSFTYFLGRLGMS